MTDNSRVKITLRERYPESEAPIADPTKAAIMANMTLPVILLHILLVVIQSPTGHLHLQMEQEHINCLVI